MKKLIIINGTMGVGKSTVSRLLLQKLTPGVYLDGDWCWNMNPFVVNEENKRMVIGNITALLRAYLQNSGFEYVIFCWVIHQKSIFDDILGPLRGLEFELHKITLQCSAAELEKRLMRDVDKGARSGGAIGRSISRLPLYEALRTVKLDTTALTPEAAADKIATLVGKQK